jgi:hypothetical protein
LILFDVFSPSATSPPNTALMPRLIRRAPLSERIKAYLNPWDFLLWVSEELNGNDWDDFQRAWAIPIGVGVNLVFIIAKANTGVSRSSGDNDVFGDYGSRRGSGWMLWLVGVPLHLFHFMNLDVCYNSDSFQPKLQMLTLATFSRCLSSTLLH